MENKKRLIDAYKLEDLVRSNSARYHHADDIIAAIAGQPTVDAVGVVQCKDCRFIIDRKDGTHGCYRNFIEDCKPDDFCSYGEREGNEV